MSIVRAGVWVGVIVTLSQPEVTVVAPNEPLAVAVFVTEPASRSAWVTVYVACR